MTLDLSPLMRHDKVALSLSMGKDSLACLWILREYLDNITVYWLNTGDAMPEVLEFSEEVRRWCPNFVEINGNVRDWIEEFGHPTDLLPYSAHGIGTQMGQTGTKLVTRYHCCFINLMHPLWSRIKEDGNTLCIRGTKLADVPKLAAQSGETHEGIELWFPVADLTDTEVLDYLRKNRAPWSPLFDALHNTPDCGRCTAWWNEGRGAYLKEKHPKLAADYLRDLRAVANAVAEPINALRAELREST